MIDSVCPPLVPLNKNPSKEVYQAICVLILESITKDGAVPKSTMSLLNGRGEDVIALWSYGGIMNF